MIRESAVPTAATMTELMVAMTKVCVRVALLVVMVVARADPRRIRACRLERIALRV